jgi:FG-GAP-like repeat/FG-GAP repeat
MTRHRIATRGATAAVVLALISFAAPGARAIAEPMVPMAPAACPASSLSDLGVGSPGATEGDDEDAGAVTLLAGTTHGLTGQALWSPASAGAPKGPSVGGESGSTVALGDFNGDGCTDLAVMALGDNTTEFPTVTVLFGNAGGGLSSAGAQSFAEGDVCDTCGGRDFLGNFANWMAVGDFNGDGYDDLALDAGTDQNDNPDSKVVVVPGSASGLIPSTSNPTFSAPRLEDPRVTSLSAGDIDGDGISDLAIGFAAQNLPSDDARPARARPASTRKSSHQSDIALIYGAHAGIGTDRSRQNVNRASKGVPGKEQVARRANNIVAITTALGDFNQDGRADLAWWEHGASTVTVLRGTKSGVTPTHAQSWSKASKGIPGTNVKDDRWGQSLATADFNGDGDTELVVGDPKTQQITVLPGSKSAGLTATGSEQLSPATPKVPGTINPDDDWSAQLAVGNFGWGSQADLAVADPEAAADRGAFVVFYGSQQHEAGLGVKHVKQFTRSSPGLPGPAEPLDFFGTSMSGR